ncbi:MULTISPECIES: tetratricopeptide repeat protein [unclassified Clostridioides]|uniref:tetratricopeptide repeat protein n=1 Tax=unclassified Clostridioides TaxID=2635829 RepID=UPI001E06575F|nr:tetratricopeptide repeat protein [Clostridioides sp. ZZV14-6150]MCC0659561.1 tetratricopeptide repeat protein [Clostridioides sp. ZZV14-6154]MCC0723782.1 tetratricopeptide repeat protein [Clostridioides sp. ZZV14-6104]MCC0725769.1 tetratricopeptide repeat protein [Clostridioides sp. ZZV14-6045]MCC0733861.1 tetratricopeptide repeat protein [Clostridioides sp. ZZV14-6009]MCC0742175.1 tetratricopeptide repeat protein [Clostridioides sp. ZZV14-6044]MCC0752127.1 tetratricopeptide repeat protein
MPRKILDISLIEENKSDLTFFNIEEEDGDETLKALKQSYVTTNYKEETLLNLQGALKSKSDTTSKELKLESYKRYNNALDLAYKDYITSAINMVNKALEINPKDIDILNLRGLLKLLKCDFAKAFESFYTALCYENNHISRKYVNLISSEDFKTFLGRYNHSIRFINEEMNYESIHILENIVEEEPQLIEPYVILSLLYDKLGNVKKREGYLDRLKEIDKDNPVFEKEEEKQEDTSKKEEEKRVKKKKNSLPYIVLACIVIAMGVYFIQSKKRIETLNNQISKKDEKLTETDKKLGETNKELEKTNKELDEAKNKEPEKEITVANEEDLYYEALDLKKNKEYEKAIDSFKSIVSSGKTKKYISESIYQLAITNKALGNKDEAIKYYKKYINTYTKNDQYYDDSYYELGMLYYDNGDLENAKKTFYSLRSEVPDSMYNNSKIKEILSKK